MLAAKSSWASSLRLFQVVLRASDQQGGPEVSHPLRAHALDVVREAVLIAQNPKLINANTAREAIELALCLHDVSALSAKLAAVPPTAPIPADLAHELLTSLQPLAA